MSPSVVISSNRNSCWYLFLVGDVFEFFHHQTKHIDHNTIMTVHPSKYVTTSAVNIAGGMKNT